MNLPNRYLYYLSAILLLLFLLFGIAKNPDLPKIDKKLVFDSIREKEGIYILKNGKPKFIKNSEDMFSPKFSPNSKIISMIKLNSIYLYDTYSKKFVLKISFLYSFLNPQILHCIWNNDGKSLFIVLRIYINNFYTYFLVEYNLETKKTKSLAKFDRKTAIFDLNNLSICQTSKYLMFYVEDENNKKLFVMNIQRKKIIYFIDNAVPIGWLPQNKGFLFYYKEYTYKNNFIMKFDFFNNFNNKKIEKIGRFPINLTQNLNLTKDGEYLFYSKKNNYNAYNIFCSKIVNNKISSEFEITKPIFINYDKGFSNDIYADLN